MSDPRAHSDIEALQRLCAHFGISTDYHDVWGNHHRVAREQGVAGPATLQNSYSLVSRQAEGDLAEVLYRQSMSLLAYSPLAAGLLSGKYRGGARPEGTRFALFDTLGARFRKPIVFEAIEAFLALAERLGLTIDVDDRLAEVDYGDWSGRALKDLASEPLWRVVQDDPAAATPLQQRKKEHVPTAQ